MKKIENGFADYYYLTENAKVYNAKTKKYLKAFNYTYYLQTKDKKAKRISIKNLYSLVYNKIYCIDSIEDLENEEWKGIAGTGGKYFISNRGRCKSVADYESRIISPFTNKGGYLRVTLCIEGKKTNKFIHTLVASAFLNPPQNLEMQIHHKDFNKENNNAENLEYLSIAEHTKKHNERIKNE